MGIENFLKNRNFVNLDYIYSTLSNSDGENPLDYKTLSQNKMEWYIVATNAVSGEAVYFDKKDAALDNYDIVKASSCIPFICKPYEINHTLYFDGGLSDPIPYKKAFEKGCDAVVVILTRPVDVPRVAKKDELLALIKDLNLEDKVLLLGFDNNPYKYMSKCEFFAFASVFEGFSNVLIESLACGCAVVCTDHRSGARELFGDDEFGLLVEVNNENSMFMGLKTMLEDENLRKAYKKKAKDRALDFDKVKIARNALKYLLG